MPPRMGEEDEFDDNRGDEEIEEEEEYGRGRLDEEYGGRKKSKSQKNMFVDDDAIVDSDDEEGEEIDGEDDFIDPGTNLADEDDDGSRHPRPSLSLEHDDHKDVEALERCIQERYAKSSTAGYYEEAKQVHQQALLPSVRDPKLWMVKCAIVRERETAVRLLQKYTNEGSELQIRSVIAPAHLKNDVYIEADKEAHVREACRGLRNILGQKIMLVPIKEMSDVLSAESKRIDLARDSWVRMKIGIYKGELAQVVDVDNARQRVTVKLIPRSDLQVLADELAARDRFIYKNVSVKSVNSQDIKPTFDELEKFCKPGKNGKAYMSNWSTLLQIGKKATL